MHSRLVQIWYHLRKARRLATVALNSHFPLRNSHLTRDARLWPFRTRIPTGYA